MQSTMSQYGAASFKGLLDGIAPRHVRSYAAEVAIGIGNPVRLGTKPDTQVNVPTAAAQVIGFAVCDHAREQNAAGLVQYAAKEAVSVMVRGRMWVETDDAVVAGAVANLKLANLKLTDEAVAAGIEAFTQISVRFLTSTSAAGLALVEIK